MATDRQKFQIAMEAEKLQKRVEEECWSHIPLSMAAPLFQAIQDMKLGERNADVR